MKRFVIKELVPPVLVAALTIVVVAITDADAGATFLIAVGFLAIALAIRWGPERLEDWREGHAQAARKARQSGSWRRPQ